MRFSKTQLSLFLALLLSNAIILYDGPGGDELRLPAALALVFVLPGWAWLPALGWLRTSQAIERLVLVAGFSSLFSALALLVNLMSLPALFGEPSVLITQNGLILAGLVVQIGVGGRGLGVGDRWEWPNRTVLLILLLIVAVAAFTRLTRIGYAEFHEDELENMRLIVRAYKGETYAPFLDSKGPIHWLLPAALWFLNGWLSEGLARAPFALTSLLLVPMVYVLGRRMSGGRDSVGLIAAGLVAVNGFFVAYARFVENQSLIVFWGALAMGLAYRAWRERIPAFWLYTALALAVGLVAHPDVLLYLPVFGYVAWLARRPGWRQEWPWLAGAGLLFAGLVALFYVPYLADPQIGLIYGYFASDRIGESFLYNSVGNLLDQDRLYSTRYHAPVLIGLLAWLLARRLARLGRSGWALFMGLSLAITTTVFFPQAWLVGPVNLAFVPYALLTLVVLGLPGLFDEETRVLFLWLSLPLGALLFLARDAADHVQIAYPAWALLAALGLAEAWAFLSSPLPSLPSPVATGQVRVRLLFKLGLVLVLVLVTPLILAYQYLAFAAPVIVYWQAKIDSETNPDSFYNRLYGSIPRPRKIFGNPSLSGWKATGYLWASGVLGGDFRSVNESYAIPIWYTFETPRSCYEDPQHYWLRRGWDGWPEEEPDIAGQGYTLTRIIRVDGEPMLRLYEKQAAPSEPEILDVEDFRAGFDRLARPARFAYEKTADHVTSLNFGDKLLLLGYDLPAAARPGDLLPVTLYWQSLAPMDLRYRGFVHLVDDQGRLWGQHDDDPACRLLTTDMRPGQRSARQFRLPLDPTTPPGEYTILAGLYDPVTLERLEIWDDLAGRGQGNSFVLGRVRIE